MAIFTNRATLTYLGGAITSNTVTGELREVITAAKNAAGSTYRMGDTVTYVISLQNAGNLPVTGLTVSDDLGAYPFGQTVLVPLSYVEGSVLYYVNDVLQAPPAVSVGTQLVFSGISIPAGGSAFIVYRAVVTDAADPAAGGSIVNTATVTGGGIVTPITASETVTAEGGAGLTIEKALSPAVLSDGEQLTYTFTVRNSGNEAAVATDDITLSDTFDPVLANITVTLNGTQLTEGVDYTYDEASGLFATTTGLITVPAATFTQDPVTGAWTATPGAAVLTVTGTV